MAIIEQDVNAVPDAPMLESSTDAPRVSKGGLLLDSLDITNFRAFRRLVVPKLGRVNLITGKNGVGKSSLLEALYLYAEAAWPDVVRQILTERGESTIDPDIPDNVFDRDVITDVTRLFHTFSEDSDNLFTIKSTFDNSRALSFHWTISNELSIQDDKVIVSVRGSRFEYRLNTFRKQTELRYATGSRTRTTIPSNFLKTNRGNSVNLEEAWSRAVIGSREDEVLNLVRLVVPAIKRIDFVLFDRFDAKRTAVVRLSSRQSVVPLASLGEGSTQIFAIASALLTTRNGFLLVDEIENGLHYSILSDVWRLIFQAARRLNVQVFATTHSWDCIEAFQKAAAEDKESEGMLIRLRNKSGDVVATVLDEEDLAVITRDGLEVR